MILDFLSQPWPWYVAGPAIALIVLLLLTNGRYFGISSSLETMCTVAGVGRWVDYFNRDWKTKKWLLIFVVGTILGGSISQFLLPTGAAVQLSENTVSDLATLGVGIDEALVPKQIFSWTNLWTWQGFSMVVLGGFFIGFGTRYAGGCTSGHAISGLANFQLPSLIATIGFFIGGLLSTYFLLPLILS